MFIIIQYMYRFYKHRACKMESWFQSDGREHRDTGVCSDFIKTDMTGLVINIFSTM